MKRCGEVLSVALVVMMFVSCAGADAAGDKGMERTAVPRGVLLIWDPSSSTRADESTVYDTLAAVEKTVLDRLSHGWSLHLFTVSQASLHQLPSEVWFKRESSELKQGGAERFRNRVARELSLQLASLPQSWSQAHRPVPAGTQQPLVSCLLSSLDRAGRQIAAQRSDGRRYQLIIVSDLQEACRDWGGGRGINLELGTGELQTFAQLDWTTDLSRVESVEVFHLPPAHGLNTGEQRRALEAAWRRHLTAAGVDGERIVFR